MRLVLAGLLFVLGCPGPVGPEPIPDACWMGRAPTFVLESTTGEVGAAGGQGLTEHVEVIGTFDGVAPDDLVVARILSPERAMLAETVRLAARLPEDAVDVCQRREMLVIFPGGAPDLGRYVLQLEVERGSETLIMFEEPELCVARRDEVCP